jgi:hypothetical protein
MGDADVRLRALGPIGATIATVELSNSAADNGNFSNGATVIKPPDHVIALAQLGVQPRDDIFVSGPAAPDHGVHVMTTRCPDRG